jgi:hypothetical protein
MRSVAEVDPIRPTVPMVYTLSSLCFHALGLAALINNAATQFTNHGGHRIYKQPTALIVKRASWARSISLVHGLVTLGGVVLRDRRLGRQDLVIRFLLRYEQMCRTTFSWHFNTRRSSP